MEEAKRCAIFGMEGVLALPLPDLACIYRLGVHLACGPSYCCSAATHDRSINQHLCFSQHKSIVISQEIHFEGAICTQITKFCVQLDWNVRNSDVGQNDPLNLGRSTQCHQKPSGKGSFSFLLARKKFN